MKTIAELARESFLRQITAEELREITGAGGCSETQTCSTDRGCSGDGTDGPNNGFPECG